MPCASTGCSLAGVCPNYGSLQSPCVHPPPQLLAAAQGTCLQSPLRRAPCCSSLGSSKLGYSPSVPSARLTPWLPRNGLFCVPRWPKPAQGRAPVPWLAGPPCWGGGGLWLRHPFATACWDGDPGQWLLLEEEEGVLLVKVASPHPIKPGTSLGSISSRSGPAGGQGKPQAVGLGCHFLLRVKALGEG